jgi:hypothetical protein
LAKGVGESDVCKLLAESFAHDRPSLKIQDSSVKAALSLGRTTPEFRMEFDKVWWGFLSLSDSLLCCQTGGTQ